MIDFSQLLATLAGWVASIGTKLLISAVILAVGIYLIRWVKKFLKTSPKMDRVDDSLRSFLVSLSNILLYAVLFITIASVLGVPMTSFITILASCGVAIGLALQGSLSNFAGGIMILLFKPFKVGDFIEASGESGTVEEVSVVYTVLLTPDNKRITIPNGTLTNSVIENYSAQELRRVDMTFRADYACDSEKVKALIRQQMEAHPLALKEPEVFVRVSACADSGVDYTARVWCKGADYWTVHFDVLEGVKKAFAENGINVPFPQMDVHIDNK